MQDSRKNCLDVELLTWELCRKKEKVKVHPLPLGKFDSRSRQPGSGNKAEVSYSRLANNNDVIFPLPSWSS